MSYKHFTKRRAAIPPFKEIFGFSEEDVEQYPITEPRIKEVAEWDPREEDDN